MLINCVAYEDGAKLGDVSVEDISELIKRPNCFVWVALNEAKPEELVQMREEFGLHDLAVEDAVNGNQRPKIEEYGDSLFAVMRTIELMEGKLNAGEIKANELKVGELNVGELDIFVGKNYVLSARSKSQRGFIDVRARCELEPALLRQGPAFVLYALMDAVVDRYFPIADILEEELETIEERIFNKGSERANIQRLYELKRKVLVLKHAVVPSMDAAGKLSGGRVPPLCANMQEYFRDVFDHLQRLNTTTDTLRDTINTAIQVNLSMVAIDESEVNKRLAAWAAIFAVATAFAGIWGMNFEIMPELKWRYGYPAAIGIMVTVCCYLYYRFRKSGWL